MKKQGNSNINSLKDLHAEMQEVRLRLKEREADLAQRWKQLPGEAVNAPLGSILPQILGNQLGSGAWKLLKGVFNLIKGKPSANDEKLNWKDALGGGATQLGFLAALKLLSGLFRKKPKEPSEA